MFYKRELEALKNSLRYRERKIYGSDIVDLASNDYLDLAGNVELFERAVERVRDSQTHAPKASMLINGYHKIHKEFEDELCNINGFEAAVVMGSGFNANIALIESLVRRGDELFIDEKYHASGLLATKLSDGKITLFRHNDTSQLQEQLESSNAKRRIIAVEGIYSMDGDLVSREIFSLAERYDAILIVDEAHSSGVVGDSLCGVFDHYNITPTHRHIKMGTLGKAYGSFGAYVLSSRHINSYLINRAKPIIYATAPSIFETALSHESLLFIQQNSKTLKKSIEQNRELAYKHVSTKPAGLIVPLFQQDGATTLQKQQYLLREGILVGAIRKPTVTKPMVRIIMRLGVDESKILKALSV